MENSMPMFVIPNFVEEPARTCLATLLEAGGMVCFTRTKYLNGRTACVFGKANIQTMGEDATDAITAILDAVGSAVRSMPTNPDPISLQIGILADAMKRLEDIRANKVNREEFVRKA